MNGVDDGRNQLMDVEPSDNLGNNTPAVLDKGPGEKQPSRKRARVRPKLTIDVQPQPHPQVAASECTQRNHGDAGHSYNPLGENGSQPEEVGVDTSGELQGNAKDMLNNEEQSRPNDSRPGSLFDCPSLDCGGLNRPFSHGIDRPSIVEDIWLDQLLGAF